MSRAVPIFVYHRVGRPSRRTRLRGMFTSPRALARHLRFLGRRGFTTCDFEELRRAREGRAELPARPVLLTFDDGHLDNRTLALDVLRAHGAKATVFVVAADVGRRGVVWDEAAEREPTDLFDWDQAGELAAAGVRIEVHGLEHRHMDRVPRARLVDEMSRAKELVAARVGVEPCALAYPFGAWNAHAAAAAREAGFAFACTTEVGVADLEHDDPFALPRLAVRGYRWVHQLAFRRALASAERARATRSAAPR